MVLVSARGGTDEMVARAINPPTFALTSTAPCWSCITTTQNSYLRLDDHVPLQVLQDDHIQHLGLRATVGAGRKRHIRHLRLADGAVRADGLLGDDGVHALIAVRVDAVQHVDAVGGGILGGGVGWGVVLELCLKKRCTTG